MDEYLRLGHMEIIPTEQCGERVGETLYLPHHFVVKSDSSTTALRVVFDASAKTSTGVSLNDILMVGPKIQDDIWDIVIRFRLHKYAFCADLAKMYRQIDVSRSDADLQRILWRDSPDVSMCEFRLTTVTYGTACGSFLATRVLRQLANDGAKLYPLASEATLRDFYVDDLLSGAGSLDGALELQSQLIALMEVGGFRLRKWSSNHPNLLESVPEEFRGIKLPLEIGADKTVKALGLHWQPAGDYFFFKVALGPQDKALCKRSILSKVAKIYDPLGLLAPVVVVAKIFIQRLWLAGVTWDEDLPVCLKSDWTRFCDELLDLGNLKVPRWTLGEDTISYQLHGFCDASEKAYAAVVFLRCETREGSFSTHLVCAKTKVSPIKQITLPRLELCGATLLTRLLKRVKTALPLTLQSVHAWTDSTVVLAWIAGLPRNWKTFVANRVAEIQELLPPLSWNYVPSKQNPADSASRGIRTSEILDNDLWWYGPSWLARREHDWPKSAFDRDSSTEASRERRSVESVVAGIGVRTSLVWDAILNYSSLTRLKRVTAYCLRFIGNLRLPREKRDTGFLTTRELQAALSTCIKSSQMNEFKDVIFALQKGKTAPGYVASLNPFVDENGILRVGGRIRYSQCHFSKRFPILLGKHHHLTELIVMDTHMRHLHAGPQATLSSLHQNYWIINGRSVVRRILHRCQPCFRERATAVHQQMGDLPLHRLEPTRAFLRCGVDFCGPFSIKSWKGRGGKVHKSYVALFICFSTKAIHLELVGDMTTDSFMATLKRFTARRGLSSDIYSDNGTTFVGARNELKVLGALFRSRQHNETISDFLASQGITWHFSPPDAPHFGGLWEAGVKSAKGHLRRVVGQTVLTFEELNTVLVQIEACLNSRPLCSISSDPNSLEALTPGHFLVGDALTGIPEPDYTKLSLNRLSRWQLVQKMQQDFWRRWHSEYLSQLQERPRWKEKQRNIEIGELVLIREDNTPPLRWKRGRVMELHPGQDGCVRVVTVKTSTGLFKRPVVKLCILPKS